MPPTMSSSPSITWQPGTLIGDRYQVVRRLSAGGMGEVYEGFDVKRDSPVALKRLVVEHSGGTLERERRFHEASVRMHREAIHTSRLGHPGIVNVLDLAYDADATPVVVMELLHGINLEEHLKYGPLTTHVAVDFMAQVLDALSVAHAAGVIHRDLKPANLFLVEDKSLPWGVRVKILDFGVSKQLSTDGSDGDENTAVTMTNVFLGSYQYASPEQFDPTKTVSPQSDLYSVGVILFRVLTGRHPAGTKNLNDVMLRTLFGNIERSVRAYRRDVPEALDAVLAGCLSPQAEQRFATADAMRSALLAALHAPVPGDAPPPPTSVRAPPPQRTEGTALRNITTVALTLLAVTGWGAYLVQRYL